MAQNLQQVKFLSTPSARRATAVNSAAVIVFRFLSTPSARRATPRRANLPRPGFDFYPRPPRGGRPRSNPNKYAKPAISIHALREEGDAVQRQYVYQELHFLSTPSARRATSSGFVPFRCHSHFYPRPPRGGRRQGTVDIAQATPISIHALREEGDATASIKSC